VLGSPVDDVRSPAKLVEKLGDLLWGVLEVVIDRDDDFIPNSTDAAQQRAVLPRVLHQLKAADPGVVVTQRADYSPAVVLALVVDQNNLELVSARSQNRLQPVDQHPEGPGTVVDRDDNGNVHGCLL
jgi:hypothetical protein